MGLTLHYELRLPPTTSPADALARLRALRIRAISIPTTQVSPFIDLPVDAGEHSATGFTVDPGRGSELATFALTRRCSDDAEEWFWSCSCKTQYASTVSDDHFVTVHTSLVTILDAAIELGFDVTVDDETDYWESRSTSALLDSLAKMNRLIASFAGRLSDALGDGHDVQAAIFEHPRFERLEMGE